MEIVTSCDRPDLKAEADVAFRVKWPEFLFPHDPVVLRYEAQVAEFFPQYDVLMLDGDRVVAGAWGVAIRWDGTLEDLPDGYDDTTSTAKKRMTSAPSRISRRSTRSLRIPLPRSARSWGTVAQTPSVARAVGESERV